MKKEKEKTFASLLSSFGYKYDLTTVFDDFLTLSMCACTPDPRTGISHYEDLYLKTIAKYKDDPLRFEFPKLFGCLVNEMEERLTDARGNDILGDYYELHLAKKGRSQFFTPWPICQFMAKSCIEESVRTEGTPLRILEPACGSGRLLVAMAREAGPHNEYYGIDLDQTCVKMTCLNLFLNGVFNAEVMCADALLPDDFRESYVISLLPLGIFRITDKEKSRLWHSMRNALKPNTKPKVEITLPSESGENHSSNAKQIQLF